MIIEKKVGGPLWPLWPSGTVILRLLRVLEGADYRMLYLKKRLCPSGLNLTDIGFEWGAVSVVVRHCVCVWIHAVGSSTPQTGFQCIFLFVFCFFLF